MSQIRRSQFLTTYGPGAILEGKEGPRVILSVEFSGVFEGDPTPFEITDQRLSRGLLDGAGILRLPSNAELGEPENVAIYNTKRFPSWSLCTRHGILYHKDAKTKETMACPRCEEFESKNKAWGQANRQLIRFVRACPAGHLDDVDWVRLIDHQQEGCQPSYLYWRGSGALKNITIECPICKGKANLGAAYSKDLRCSGRFPEREADGSAPQRRECTEHARIIQRGAANLRIPELQTSLIIPKCDSNLHLALQIGAILDVLSYSGQPASKQEFIEGLNKLVARKRIPQTVVQKIELYDESEILIATGDVLNLQIPQSPYELRRDEFRALISAATDGHPPLPPKRQQDIPNFEVNREAVNNLRRAGKLRLRVTPVNRLRVLMVQTGYQRIPAGQIAQAKRVDIAFKLPADRDKKWYIGSELSGEGIFIDLDVAHNPANRLNLQGSVAQHWWQAWRNPEDYTGNSLMQVDRHQFHPVFVWWHTFAHRLINALAVDSGYSSAAIRERIFIDVDPDTGEADGGLLLYTAQPGGDGTLGGLIALVPEFERVLERALHNLDICSNDPLCGEEEFGKSKYNGAACYACALISETSCEHRNICLDRKLLLERLP